MQFLSILVCTGILCGLMGNSLADEREARQSTFNDGAINYIMLDGNTKPIDLPGINSDNFPSSGASLANGPLNGFMPLGIDGPLALFSQATSGGGQLDTSGLNQMGNSLNFAGQSGPFNNPFGNSFPNSGLGGGGNPTQGITPFINFQNNFPFNGNPTATPGGGGFGFPGQVSGSLGNLGLSSSLLGGLPGPGNPSIGQNGLQGFGGFPNLNQFTAMRGPAASRFPPSNGVTGVNNMRLNNLFMGPNGFSGSSRLPGLFGANGFPGANQQMQGSIGGLGALQSTEGLNDNSPPSSASSGRSTSQNNFKK